ncbi:myeloblastin-like isoform X2 [Convolutriloba macropyga]|uniref:myeloblastin-like isoform X2 n=1 Tax=Convolutriloba macropyga TaxID=536237 RepID=UPI003F52675C
MAFVNFVLNKLLIYFVFGAFALSLGEVPTSSYKSNYTIYNSLHSLIINGVQSNFRPFYAKLKYLTEFFKYRFCGATIIHQNFFLTAAHCVFWWDESEIVVEVGDFSKRNTPKTTYHIVQKLICPGFEMGNTPKNDLALLKTDHDILGAQSSLLKICSEDQFNENPIHVMLGTCGMGSVITSNKDLSYPDTLREMYLRPHPWMYIQEYQVPCRDDNICTTSVLDRSNICFMDQGGPLYKLRCGSLEPECLYGVASYSMCRMDTPNDVCNYGSYFVNISKFVDWIDVMFFNHALLSR